MRRLLFTCWRGDVHDGTQPPREATEAEALAFALPLVRKAFERLDGPRCTNRIPRCYGRMNHGPCSCPRIDDGTVSAMMAVLEAAAKGEKP